MSMGNSIMMNELIPLPKKIEKKKGSFSIPQPLSVYQNFDSKIITEFFKEQNFKKVSSFNKSKLLLSIEKNLKELKNVDKELKEEGYLLEIKKENIQIKAINEKGIFYGLQTLNQLIENKKKLENIKIIDFPDMKFRGVHLNLEKYMPTFEKIKELIIKFASYKINSFVIEYDDRFPWEKHPAISHPEAYSKEQIKELISIAAKNFIEIIPLLDSLGHAQQYLKHNTYSYLKELPDRIDEMCPSNPKTLKFIKELWSEVLEIHKSSKYVHISGDEVFRMGEFCVLSAINILKKDV